MKFIFIIIFSFICISSGAQTLKGLITDGKGEPIPYATIYVEEVALGIVSDDRGEFQTTLEKGTYTFIASSLGHEKKKILVIISDSSTSLEITLQEKVYQLNEVTIKAGGEDPAYQIMRKAIVMAPFHLHQVKSYQANVYLKGTLKVDKIPALVKRQIKDPRIKNAENKLFLIESQNEVNFTAPNKYDQKVIALSNTIPIEFDNNMAMGIINSNIYSPDIMGIVSPLAPHAFSHYNYKLEGITLEGQHLVNKIRVIPKKKNVQLVRGYIYIVENYWNIQHADLTASQSGVTLNSNISYNEIRPGAFLPTSYDMKASISVMGVNGEAKYYSSVQYKNVEVNSQYNVVPSKTIDEEVVKESKQLVKVRKNLKSKDLEIKPRDSVVNITHDTLSLLRDSLYWLEVRQLPLRPEEIISYRQRDSLKLLGDSLKKADSLQNRTMGAWTKKLLFGEKLKLGEKYTLGYDGILSICPEYNFVDGFWIGQKFHLGIDFMKSRSLQISPLVYYMTARKNIAWMVENNYTYDPIRHGKITVLLGNITEDYSGINGTSRLNNSFASLLFATNTAKLYQKKFIYTSHKIDIVHALQLTINASYDKRNSLINHISYSFFGGNPKTNLPGRFTELMPTHGSFRLSAQIEYTPRYHYRIWKGEKFYAYSNYPTFTLKYERGIPVNTGDASFEVIEANIQQSIKLNIFNKIHYSINGGIFPSSKTIYLPDYKHFAVNELFITNMPLTHRFNLLDNYTYVTNEKWLTGDIELSSAYLLLKHIRFMQSYLFDESLHLRSLWIPGRNFTEFGYSIGFRDIGRIGVFAGLANGKYDAIGCTISIPIIRLLLGK